MSLLAIEATLEDRPTLIVDGNLLETDDAAIAELRRILSKASRSLLAVTVMPGPQLEQAIPLTRALRDSHPETVVVWGGYFPSQHWDVCLESGLIDFVVRSHGDLVFPELVRRLEEGLSTADLAGLASPSSSDGDAPTSNALAPIPKPDQLPTWNLDKVDLPRYLRKTFLGERTVGYNSSYGCPFFCNFCAVVNLVEGKWLSQSAERVADAAALYVKNYNVDAIEFVDNNFFVHQKRVAEFSERIQHLNIAWWGEGRIDTMLAFSDATWRSMRDAGLKMVFLGAESGSEETLARMDKGGKMSPDKTREMVEVMARWDIVPELSFVLGNPPDPETDTRSTMEFVREIKTINPRTEIILYQYTPVPLSGDLFHQAKKSGFEFPTTLEGWADDEWLDFSQRRAQDTMPWVGESLAKRLRNFERVLNAYYPTSTFQQFSGWRGLLLRAASGWRYHTKTYAMPYELALLQRLLRYQRPETSGF